MEDHNEQKRPASVDTSFQLKNPSKKMKTIPQAPEDAAIKTTFSSNVSTRATEQLFMDKSLADFHFVFNSHSNSPPMKLPVHKIILAAASPVFRTMFYGSLTEKAEVEIVDASFDAFKEFLQFFYLTDVTLTMEHVPGVMYLGDKYEVDECLETCSKFLMQHLTAKTVCWAYELAILFKRKDLKKFCNMMTKCRASAVLQSNGFLECDQKLLRRILELNGLNCSNLDLFNAYIAWAKVACQRNGLDVDEPQNIRAQLGQVLFELPFATLTQADFFDIISHNINLFEKQELTEIIQMIASQEFQPTIFVKKNSSEGTSSSDQNKIINCSRIIADSFLIKNIETTTFSSNKPFLLMGFSCANVYHFIKKEWRYSVMDFPTSKITVTKKCELKGQDENSSAILFEGEITLTTNRRKQITLPSPILIRPWTKYKICLQQRVPPSSYTFTKLKSIIHLKPDVTIRFHSDATLDYDNTATGLVTDLLIEGYQKNHKHLKP